MTDNIGQLKEAIKALKNFKAWYYLPSHGSIAFDSAAIIQSIDTVVEALEKPLPNNDEAGTMAAMMAFKTIPNITAQEEAFFIAGFIECATWMRNLRKEEKK